MRFQGAEIFFLRGLFNTIEEINLKKNKDLFKVKFVPNIEKKILFVMKLLLYVYGSVFFKKP